ncbi:unnamed protein product, partial [Brenthis ino]
MTLQILKMTTLLSVLFTTHEILAFQLNSLVTEPHSFTQNLQSIPNLSKSDKEYIQNIYSMINAYKRNMDSKIFVETRKLINTKYQTWKRNGDLINSLLTLPKDMMDAGR